MADLPDLVRSYLDALDTARDAHPFGPQLAETQARLVEAEQALRIAIDHEQGAPAP